MNIPQLRFPVFQGEWEKKKLEDLTENISSGKSKDKASSGLYPFYGSTGKIGYSNNFDYSVKKILIARVGANAGSLYKVEGDYSVTDNTLMLDLFEDIDVDFIYSYLVKKDLNKLVFGSGQPLITGGQLKSFEILLPKLSEQTKIASFLTAVDEKIQALKKKHSLLEQYKKGVMQRLFLSEAGLSGFEDEQDKSGLKDFKINQDINNPKILKSSKSRFRQLRFKDKNGNDFPEWEMMKLGEVCVEHLLKNKNKETEEVFSVAKHKGVINQIEHLGRSFSAKEILHYKLIFPGDLVYTKSPTSDFPFGIIKQNRTGRIGVVSPLYCVFQPKTFALGYILHEYFNSAINTLNYLSPLVQKGAKNTMNINNDTFLNGAKLLLPIDEKEQTAIANFLSALDEKIHQTQTQIEKTEVWKKGLLQKLFC